MVRARGLRTGRGEWTGRAYGDCIARRSAVQRPPAGVPGARPAQHEADVEQRGLARLCGDQHAIPAADARVESDRSGVAVGLIADDAEGGTAGSDDRPAADQPVVALRQRVVGAEHEPYHAVAVTE